MLASRCRSLGARCALVMVACAGVVVLSGCGSSSASVVVARWAGREVLLLPIVRGGAAGWCITVVPGGGCPVSRLKRGPILAEFWVSEGGRNHAEGFALTTSVVTAVAVHGSRPVATRRERGMPLGLREVAVKIHGTWAPEVETPPLFGKRHMVPAHLPRFTPMDRGGMPLAQNDEEGSLVAHELAGKGWSPPAPEPTGACELHAAESHGLVTNAGFVITHPEPLNDLFGSATELFGRPFLSCASTSYSLKGWPIVASVLLDARDPGTSPAPLPHTRAVARSKDVFDALSSNGPIVARRVPGAWLVVSGGEGEAQRQMLLEHLRATVHMEPVLAASRRRLRAG